MFQVQRASIERSPCFPSMNGMSHQVHERSGVLVRNCADVFNYWSEQETLTNTHS